VLGASLAAGATVDQSYCHHTSSQFWQINTYQVTDHRTGGCGCTVIFDMFYNSNSSECLALADLSGANGTPVIQLDCNPSDSRQWWTLRSSYVQVSGFDSPAMMLASLGVGNKCLDVDNGQSIDQLPMQVWDCNQFTPNQAWAWLGS